QAALPESRQPVALADGFRLVRQVESRARFGARHESIRRSKTRIHQSGAGAGLKVPDGFVHDIAQCAPSLQANVADLLRGQQVRRSVELSAIVAWSGNMSEIWISGFLVRIGWHGPRISRGASGFMSQVSNWLGAPRLKIRIADFSSFPLSTAPRD